MVRNHRHQNARRPVRLRSALFPVLHRCGSEAESRRKPRLAESGLLGTDRTSTAGARSTRNMVTRTGTPSPFAQAIACFTLLMSLRPAGACFWAGGFLFRSAYKSNSFSCDVIRRSEAAASGCACRPPKGSSFRSSGRCPERTAESIYCVVDHSRAAPSAFPGAAQRTFRTPPVPGANWPASGLAPRYATK
jgi:hypothetical protein